MRTEEPRSVCLERPLEMTLIAPGEWGRDEEERLDSASGIAEAELSARLTRSPETGLRWEIIEALTHIACWKWRCHGSFGEIEGELTRLTLSELSKTDQLPGREVYGALGEDFKTALTSTFERLIGVFFLSKGLLLEDRSGVSVCKEKIDAAAEISRDALAVVRHLALTLNLVDLVNPANRPIVDEAIGRGMVVRWMEPDGERASEPAAFSVFGKSGAYVVDVRGISYSEAACNEVAERIFGGKNSAGLRPVGKIEFDRRGAEQEMAYRRERAKLNLG